MLNFNDVMKALADYETVVLTIVEESGYPLSVRCRFTVDPETQRLHLMPMPGVEIHAGDASLLCHSHDAALDNLRTLTIRGKLTHEGDEWVFVPVKFQPGLGMNGFWRDVVQGAIIGPRRSAKQYLEKHGLSRPQVPWDVLKKLAGE